MTELTRLPAWQALGAHKEEMAQRHMRDMFDADPTRFERFSLEFHDILLDYSKNRIDDRTMALLFQLARECHLPEAVERMFRGEPINTTEHRSALHVALRNRGTRPMLVDGRDVMPGVRDVLRRMRNLVNAVHQGEWKGYMGHRITDVVNIGIGGSDLGPVMVTEALKPYGGQGGISVHYMSNVDGSHVVETLNRVRPESTLFVVASKSFGTQETLTNAMTVRDWLLAGAKDNADAVARHFVAVTANTHAATEFGIAEENVFEFWDWVGGRYSMWSAIGLPIALYLGMDHFEDLLAGAHAMDEHFRSAPLEANMPVIMAMLGIWYNDFFGAQSHAILPYDQHLHRFPAYLQQGDMESNGKSTTLDGEPVDYATGPVIWGETGTNGQHAYFQLLHQGTRLVPADFIAPVETYYPIGDHQTILLANFFAQTRALMRGKDEEQIHAELEDDGYTEAEIAELTPHKVLPGNRPTNTIMVQKITPHTLGALVALYEHKIYTQSVIWHINAFDQWGVEFGKQMTGQLLPLLDREEPVDQFDPSTNGLVNWYKCRRRR